MARKCVYICRGSVAAYACARPLLHVVLFLEQHTQTGQEQSSSQVEWTDRLVSLGLSFTCLHPFSPDTEQARLSVSGLITHAGSTMTWIHPFSFLMQSLHQHERERGCCSKSPLPRFCCTYYAICFRSLIRVLADHKDTECVWERKRSIQDLSGTLYTKPTVTDRPAAMETSEPYGHSLI